MPDPSPNLHPIEAAARQRTALARFMRVLFLALFVTVTLLSVINVSTDAGKIDAALTLGWPVTLAVAAILAVTVVLIDVLTPNKKISTLFSVFVGMIAAILATVAIGFIIDLFVKVYDIKGADSLVASIKVLIGIALAYLGITTVLQTQDDFRLVIPYVEFAKQLRGPRPMLLDSSALIDARIVEIGATGLLQSPLVIPRFVIGELQSLADSQDKSARGKGRRGLEVIQRLQRSPQLDVTIDDTPVPGKAVDQMLVELARQMPGMVVTTDLALARIARIHGVGVLNLNDLAAAVRSPAVPGEVFTLRITKPGEQPGQGVAHLDDGTMVVVENGQDLIGQTAPVVIVSAVQTSGGRIVFAKPKPQTDPDTTDAAPAAGSASPATEEPDPTSIDDAPVATPPPPTEHAADADTASLAPPRPAGPFPPKSPDARRAGLRNPRR